MRAFRTTFPMVLLAGLVASCGASGSAGGGDPVQVVTTFFPITAFTTAVAGDCVTVVPLMAHNVGPHDFQASPADLVKLRQAAVLVRNGLGLESFLDKLIVSAGNPELQAHRRQ